MSTSLTTLKTPPPGRARRWTDLQFILLVLGVTLLFRIAALLRVGIIGTDGLLYCQIATEILEGRWLESNRTLLFNPYPALIALLHSSTGISLEWAGQLLNALPGGLAVVPLYLWCSDAFGRRVAVSAAWIFALHPMLIRYTAPVMRDGFYWFCMLQAIQLYWSALRRGGVGRYLLCGILTTAAALTRTEGTALFGLFILWGLLVPRLRPVVRWERPRRAIGVGIAGLVLPLVLIALNVIVLPPGEPFSGFERLGMFSTDASNWISNLKHKYLNSSLSIYVARWTPAPAAPLPPQIPTSPVLPAAEIKLASASPDSATVPSTVATLTSPHMTTTVKVTPPISDPAVVFNPPPPVTSSDDLDDAETIIPLPELIPAQPSPRTFQQVMDSISVWNSEGDNIDPQGYYLRRFLMLADEHRLTIYWALFCRQLLHGFRLPIVILFCLGAILGYRQWRFGRDLPLVVHSALLVWFMFVHLTKTNVLEARYLISILPLVFPWTARGLNYALILVRTTGRNKLLAPWSNPRRLIPAVALLSFLSVFWALRLTRDEVFQKQFGSMLISQGRHPDCIAGNESFARCGFYLDAPYHKLPPSPDQAWNVIVNSRPDYILLRTPQESIHTRLIETIDRSPAFERILAQDPRFERYLIYRARPLIAAHLTGSSN